MKLKNPKGLVYGGWVGILIIVIAGSVYGQVDRWNQLNSQIMQLVSSGRAADAVPLGKEALDVARQTFGTEDLNYGMALNNLAWAYSLSGKYSDAEPLFKKSISLLEKLQTPQLSLPLGNLANMYAAQSRFVEAEAVASRSLEVITKYFGSDSANAAAAEAGLAQIYANGGKPAEAERLYKDALATEQKTLPPDHVELGRTYGNLGYLYETEGKRTEAEDMYRKALSIFEKTLSPQDPLLKTTQQYLARVTGGSSGVSEAALFQQCMNEKIRVCIYDCTVNYKYKESKCANELCSTTNPKTSALNNNLWVPYCQRKARRQVQD
jgi:tetratricopeptide (TPR) repeat protein